MAGATKYLPTIINHFANVYRLVVLENPSKNLTAYIQKLSHVFGANNKRLWKISALVSQEGKVKCECSSNLQQKEKILNEPAAMYWFNEMVFVILSGY